jgi:hypothetical protein
MLMGCPGYVNRTGISYLYQSGSNWPTTPTETYTDPVGVASDHLGWVGMANGLAVAGSPHNGKVYLYVRGGMVWPTAASVTISDPDVVTGSADEFGDYVGADVGSVIVSAWGFNNEHGAAYIYSGSGTTWNTSPVGTLLDPA